ncbi:lysosomal dipeptide transporter MFSD1-like [Saccoglossus kowalevskii]|uniref:Lysosomal dipeptide transporter MFSD1 n=1 Tax=Saccoglossus kowalevskii TaxID=10224 RepID=A0ABM0GZM7_SACKO|nr:PREDICTED: major facilitator superfamily domain-containing protein 1-like [Saccoglossus kowalevskii]
MASSENGESPLIRDDTTASRKEERRSHRGLSTDRESPLARTSFSPRGFAACDPRRGLHRYLVLILMCFLSFGSYYVYDNPAALQKHMKDDLDLSTSEFMMMYSLYSWPNVILCFFGGFLLDSVFGIRLGTILFSCIVVVGQCIFALGASLGGHVGYIVMCTGRFVFGLGGENLAVAQNTYAVSWFKNRELNMVFGLQLSFSRVGSTVNMNIMGPIYDLVSNATGWEGYRVLGIALWVGAGMCVLSLICAIVLAFFDKRASRILKKEDSKTGEVIALTDIKHFPAELWLIFFICVSYYVTIFPFIDLGVVFFEEKFDLSPNEASAVNSLVYILSAVASPVLGFIVDRTGRNVFWIFVAVTCTLGAHMMLAFSFFNPYIAMVLMGLAYSLLACALWPLVAFVVPENQLGTAYGCMQSIQNLGLAVIAIVAGQMVDVKGYLLLEVFFLAWLCVALICVVLLYLIDASRGGALNMSAAERNKRATEAAKVGLPDKEPDEAVSPLKPQSDFHLRNRYLSRIGAKLPDNYTSHLSTLSRRGVLQ